MKRGFEFKDAKNLISDYRAIKTGLMYGIAAPDGYKERIVRAFFDMQSKGIFSRVARREMLGGITQESLPQFDQLIWLLYRYSKSLDVASRCSVLKEEIEEPVGQNIRSFDIRVQAVTS